MATDQPSLLDMVASTLAGAGVPHALVVAVDSRIGLLPLSARQLWTSMRSRG